MVPVPAGRELLLVWAQLTRECLSDVRASDVLVQVGLGLEGLVALRARVPPDVAVPVPDVLLQLGGVREGPVAALARVASELGIGDRWHRERLDVDADAVAVVEIL